MSRLTRSVALLRGINVGGKNKLPMSRLVTIFESLGCEQVRTYIQSGNVVFKATAGITRGLPNAVSAQIESTLGLRAPVILRSAAELSTAIERHPFAAASLDTAHLHVMFLAGRPTAARIAALDPERSAPDRYVVRGREIYLHCPNGVARSKLTNAYFDSRLDTVSTARNWNTLNKLRELCQA